MSRSLVEDQKFEAAADEVPKSSIAAREDGHTETWTRALIEEVQLRTALHGYETSVRFLRSEEPWPDDAPLRAMLDLYYANALIVYNQLYSWEIRQRERVAPTRRRPEGVDHQPDRRGGQQGLRPGLVRRASWGDALPRRPLPSTSTRTTIPARIRGTLRDAVTYMWVGLLADTSLWRPEQSNEVFSSRPRRPDPGRSDDRRYRSGRAERPPAAASSALLLTTWRAGTARAAATKPPTRPGSNACAACHAAFSNDEDKRAVASI